MARKASKATATVIGAYVYGETSARIDTPEWFQWLEDGNTFSFQDVTFRAELRRKWGLYWYAFKKIDGKLRKAYAGRTITLTSARLNDVAAALHRETLPSE